MIKSQHGTHSDTPSQEKLEKRVKELTPLATGCSAREVAILAAALEELYADKGIDAMRTLMIIQVVPCQ